MSSTGPVYKRLDQLIALAKCGKKFEAYNRMDNLNLTQDQFITAVAWSTDAITALWEYREIIEPRVVEFETIVKGPIRHNLGWIEAKTLLSLSGCKVKVVVTEVIE